MSPGERHIKTWALNRHLKTLALISEGKLNQNEAAVKLSQKANIAYVIILRDLGRD